MMNFSLKTKKSFHRDSGKARIAKAVGYTGMTLVVLYLFHSGFASLAAGSVEGVLHVRNYFAQSTAALPSYIRGRAELEDSIAELKSEIASQSGNEATIARLMEENNELRSLLGDTPDERLLAGVVARPPYTPYDLLVIDRGSTHGVREGAFVYHAHEHVIGVVTRAYERMSLVSLFSSSGTETTVYVYGPNIFAYAYGEGGGVIRVSVPQGIAITEGDVVVLPSIHMGDLGKVERVVSQSTQPEQSAYVTFPIPIQSLRTVLVSKEVIEPPDLEQMLESVTEINTRFLVPVPEYLRLGTATSTQGGASTTEEESLVP